MDKSIIYIHIYIYIYMDWVVYIDDTYNSNNDDTNNNNGLYN